MLNTQGFSRMQRRVDPMSSVTRGSNLSRVQCSGFLPQEPKSNERSAGLTV